MTQPPAAVTARPAGAGFARSVVAAVAAGLLGVVGVIGLGLGLGWWRLAGGDSLPLYTVTGNQVEFPGVDPGSPQLLVADTCADSMNCVFLLAQASLGEADLRGVVATPEFSACQQGACPQALQQALADVGGHLGLLTEYGFENVPAATAGPDTDLVAPPSGDIDDTAPVPSPGSDLILAQARQATPGRPLIVTSAGPGTALAAAYLADPSIAERMIVVLPELSVVDERWAMRIIRERLPTVIAHPPPVAVPAAGDSLAARIERELPEGGLRAELLAQSKVQAGDVVGDAAFSLYLARPVTWRGVVVGVDSLLLDAFDGAQATAAWFATMASPALHARRPPPSPEPPDFSVKVNFAPDDADVPRGYVADNGLVFGNRGDGLSYGWDEPVSDDMRERGEQDDLRFDTLTHMQKDGDRTWEIAVPDGTYDVRLVVGDPVHADSINRLSIEGTVVDDKRRDHFDERNVTVAVTDGRLTITPADGADNAKICFIEITSTT